MTRCVSVVLILLSIHVSGCGDAENGPVDMKPADTSKFDAMKDEMTKNLKGVPKGAVPKPKS